MERRLQGPEVIVVHIPKTAGAAFNVVLESVYGAESVENDKSELTPGAKARSRDLDAYDRAMQAAVDRRTSWPKVVTGHFPATKYRRFWRSAFTIVWLREPAARLLSQFFYMRSRPSWPDARSAARGAIPPERIMDARWPSNPITRRWFRGYDVDDFDFVGIQEHFAEDVADLGQILGWPEVEIPVHNRTTAPDYLAFRPSDELLQKIRAVNQADVALYQRALELRRSRIAGPGSEAAVDSRA